jgi:hypothetical protein
LKGNEKDMMEKGKARNKGKIRKIVALRCDLCGKESHIKEVNLYKEELDAINSNNGCYCSKCRLRGRKGFSYSISAGDSFIVYPKVISMREFQERQEGVARAKEMLRRGLEQLKK